MDLIKAYLNYTRDTEPPYIFHRWCAISSIGALLGRNYYLPFGSQRIFPNLYTMLLGDAGARKSTAIKLAKRLLTSSGYETIAANKTRIEKFLIDLEGLEIEGMDGKKDAQKVYDAVMNDNLWGKNAIQEPKETFVMADEWNVFAGAGNMDMYDILGDLWDWDDEHIPFRHRLKNSKSVSIFQPTISILGGTNLTNFIRSFPPETLEQGILSRMILIGGERSSRKYTIPPTPSEVDTNELIKGFREVRQFRGMATTTDKAFKILDALYNSWSEIDDVRFRSYSNRRFTQLIKLCLIISASRLSRNIDDEICIIANTTLSAAEVCMPKSLGEFGKSKNSDVANKIMELLYGANHPVSVKDIWVKVHQDLEKAQMLQEILSSLQLANKIQFVKEGAGYLPKMKPVKKQAYVDWEILTEEERGDL